jgi:PmbA protein
MSSELLAIADRVIGWARDDEQVEVVVGRSTETEIRVYEGDIESLSSAGTAGVGVRVVTGNRQGFAYAGTLDENVLGEVLAEARDNATFATEDPFLGLAEPDGVPVPELDLYRDALETVSTDDKVTLALELEAAVRAADDRITGV